jgi:hypothetical protein
MVSSGLLHSRENVIRCLIKEGCFDIVNVTDTSVTLCVSDEPEEMLALTGWVFSPSFRLTAFLIILVRLCTTEIRIQIYF